MNEVPDNPFRPGAGKIPPVRAGHERAARVLKAGLRSVLGRKQGDIIVLFGPRGNGKTTLLTELRKSVTGDDAWVRVLHSETMTRPRHEVARYLIRGSSVPERDVESAGLSILQVGGHLKYGEAPEFGIEEALAGILEKKSLLLCVDEAHEMCPKFGQHLLQVAQDLVSTGSPLLLVLAGTPLLKSHLSTMGASFWERCTRLPIGRLESDDEVRKALAQPAKAAGLPFDEDALELLVAESQRYPYFVQILGHHSWEMATTASDDLEAITLKDAKRGVKQAEATRNAFHAGRRNEARRQKILPYAEAVSKVMVDPGGDGCLQMVELERVLEEVSAGSEISSIEAQEKLEHLGLIWSETDETWEPGIPSLCSYIVKKIKDGAG